MDTADVPGSFDQVDLTVTVAEKPTGSIQPAGISSADGFGVSFGFKQDNAFGSCSGWNSTPAKQNWVIVFNTTNLGNFTEDGISRSFDISNQRQHQ